MNLHNPYNSKRTAHKRNLQDGDVIKKNKNMKRSEIRRIINEVGNVFFELMYNTNEELGNIAGEFMSLNEEYVLNYHGKEEANQTVNILRTGFTTNQKRFLERLRYTILGKGEE
jgi:hypothetical protein